ncbi:MAG TPA: hypothetical protein VN325_43960 [Steroidobacteraceae bacterium]|nr:hypothetical protein [Steroidobacteraceae bacterium]
MLDDVGTRAICEVRGNYPLGEGPAVDIVSLPSDNMIIEQFAEAMRAHDIDIDEPIIADGKLHRYRVESVAGAQALTPAQRSTNRPSRFVGVWPCVNDRL